MFQSTHPRGVRHQSISTACTGCSFQSTHPRGVRPASVPRARGQRKSFNPRTRAGCDSLSGHEDKRPAIVSIHAPARGATNQQARCLRSFLVSIHAPARGATCRSSARIAAVYGFNPRTRAGCDIVPMGFPSFVTSFNPRTRAGCDLPHQSPPCGSPRFNPRTRAGCDSQGWKKISPANKFQSTHPRGVRQARRRGGSSWTQCFNPRTRAGCDHFATIH